MSEAKVLYILKEFGGEWEDSWHHELLACFDKGRLEKLAEQKRIELVWYTEARDKYYEFSTAWRATNPAPEVPEDPELLAIPRWPSIAGQKQIITDEMRAERVRLQDENIRRTETVRAPWRLLQDDWAVRYATAIDEWELQNGCIGVSKRDRDVKGYSVDAVPFME